MNGGKVEYTFLWFIENYRYYRDKVKDELYSPHFNTDELERTRWRISVFPRGESEEDKGYISLHLNRSELDEGPENVSLNYEMSILDKNGLSLRSRWSGHKFDFTKRFGCGWANFILIDDAPEDILAVRCRIWKEEGEVLKIPPICARTRIGVENISFLHVVDNFSTLERHQKKRIEIRSHSKKGFVVSSTLYFSDNFSREGDLIVDITQLDSNHILCKRKISLIGVSGNIVGCGENENYYDFERKDIQKLPLSLTRQVILNKKSEYLPADKLSLLCECAFSIGLEFERIEETQHEIPTKTEDNTAEIPCALEEIKSLYVNQRHTDVELKTKTKSFLAHKLVLCARSPVFDAMFTNNMKEKSTGCIEVDDLEADIVEQLLFFFYSDKTQNLQWNTATKLYYAGDKYQILKLKETCSFFLIGNLTTTNASELLVLADTHGDSNLKNAVENFLLDQEKEVFGSKEWETLIETKL